MIYDLMSSLSAGLLVLLCANLFFSIEVLSKSPYKKSDDWYTEKMLFVIGVTCVCAYMFIGSVGWLLWQGAIITKAMQYKIGLLGRGFAISSAIIFFLTLSLGLCRKHKVLIVGLAVLVCIITYLYKAIK